MFTVQFRMHVVPLADPDTFRIDDSPACYPDYAAAQAALRATTESYYSSAPWYEHDGEAYFVTSRPVLRQVVQ